MHPNIKILRHREVKPYFLLHPSGLQSEAKLSVSCAFPA